MSPKSIDPVTRVKTSSAASDKTPTRHHRSTETPPLTDEVRRSVAASTQKKSKPIFGASSQLFILAALTLVGFIAGGVWLSQRQAAGVDADFVNYKGIVVKQSAARELMEFYKQTEGENPVPSAEDKAKQTIARYVGLIDSGKEAGLDVSQSAIQRELDKRYESAGGREAYYKAQQKTVLGSPKAQEILDTVTTLVDTVGKKTFATKEYSIVFIRYDTARTIWGNGQTQEQVEAAIKQKLVTQYLPLYKSNASMEQLMNVVDIKANGTAEERSAGRKVKYSSTFSTLTNVLTNTDPKENRLLALDPEMEGVLAKLKKKGDYTPEPIKTRSGVIGYYRLESFQDGKFTDITALDNDYYQKLGMSSKRIKPKTASSDWQPPLGILVAGRAYAAVTNNPAWVPSSLSPASGNSGYPMTGPPPQADTFDVNAYQNQATFTSPGDPITYGGEDCLDMTSWPYAKSTPAAGQPGKQRLSRYRYQLQIWVQIRRDSLTGPIVDNAKLKGDSPDTSYCKPRGDSAARQGAVSGGSPMNMLNGAYSPYTGCNTDYEIICDNDVPQVIGTGVRSLYDRSYQIWRMTVPQNRANVWPGSFEKSIIHQTKYYYTPSGAGGNTAYDAIANSPLPSNTLRTIQNPNMSSSGTQWDLITVDCSSDDYSFTIDPASLPAGYTFDPYFNVNNSSGVPGDATGSSNSLAPAITIWQGESFNGVTDQTYGQYPLIYGRNSAAGKFTLKTSNQNLERDTFLTLVLKPKAKLTVNGSRNPSVSIADTSYVGGQISVAQSPYQSSLDWIGQNWNSSSFTLPTPTPPVYNQNTSKQVQVYAATSGSVWTPQNVEYCYNQSGSTCPSWSVATPSPTGGGIIGLIPPPLNEDTNLNFRVNYGLSGANITLSKWSPSVTSQNGNSGQQAFPGDVSFRTSAGNNVVCNASANCSTTTFSAPFGGQPSSINVTSVNGWEYRGFSVTSAACGGCSHDESREIPAAPGRIITGSSGNQSFAIPVTYSATTITIGGQVVNSGGTINIRVYFKPAKISVQGRVLIDQQRNTDRTDFNPCGANIAPGNYKQKLCDVKIRAIRMNTAQNGFGWTKTFALSTDPTRGTGDRFTPFGTGPCNWVWGYGWVCSQIGDIGTAFRDDFQPRSFARSGDNCVGDPDFVPNRPGYNYPFRASYFCARDDTGTAALADATPWVKAGTTWDASTGGITTNSDPKENNLAVFQNLYPGKWTLEYDNNTVPSTVINGVNEKGYDVRTATCDPGVTHCADPASGIAAESWPANGGCLLNTVRIWYMNFFAPNRVDYGGCSNFYPSAGFVANPANNNQPVLSQALTCAGFPAWACSTYNSSSDSFPGVPNGSGYAKNVRPFYSYNFLVDANNGMTEATFNFIPRFTKVTSQNTTMLCNQITTKVVYVPDPTRNVTTYFRFEDNDLNDIVKDRLVNDSGQVITKTTGGFIPNGADNSGITVDVPKYNGPSSNASILKDGQSRNFAVYARYPDSDLQSGYSQAQIEYKADDWKYSAERVDDNSLNHVCANQASCDINTAQNVSAIDADDSGFNVSVTVKNTGFSYWMNNITESPQTSSRSTAHQLSLTTSTPSGQPSGWEISNGSLVLKDEQIYPSSTDAGFVVNPSTPNIKKFDFRIKPPQNGGSKVDLAFDMWNGVGAQSDQASHFMSNSAVCKTTIEVRPSYKPWLRVQNGGLSGLGKIIGQPEGARGTYKALNSTGQVASPRAGSSEWVSPSGNPSSPASNGTIDINLNAQYVVASSVGNTRFCSANAYGLGRDDDTTAAAYNPVSKDCSLGKYDLNIDSDLKTALKNSGSGGTIWTSARDLLQPGAALCDDSDPTNTDKSGPTELSSPSKYFRFGGQIADSQLVGLPTIATSRPSLVTLTSTTPGTPITRFCPTVYKFDNKGAGSEHTLGGFILGAGRGTLIIDGDLRIVGNIDYANQGNMPIGDIDDVAPLNKLPNLGVIVNGNITIDPSVTLITGSFYATGQIRTCSNYITSNAGLETTGRASSTPNVPPTTDDTLSAGCNKKLTIKGTLGANSYRFGRNSLDFTDIVARMNALSPAGQFTPSGKFCSTATGSLSTCGINDFDSPSAAVLQAYGYPQSVYWGRPAEDILGNGMSMVLPPPGFVNIGGSTVNRARYIDSPGTPRF